MTKEEMAFLEELLKEAHKEDFTPEEWPGIIEYVKYEVDCYNSVFADGDTYTLINGLLKGMAYGKEHLKK